MSDAMFGTVTSMYTVGGFAGSLIADRIMDRFGRRGAIKTNAFLVALGSAVMAASSSVNSLIVGRYVDVVSMSEHAAHCPLQIHCRSWRWHRAMCRPYLPDRGVSPFTERSYRSVRIAE
jgi:hypothetical protein